MLNGIFVCAKQMQTHLQSHRTHTMKTIATLIAHNKHNTHAHTASQQQRSES